MGPPRLFWLWKNCTADVHLFNWFVIILLCNRIPQDPAPKEVQTNDFITGAIGRAVNDYRKHPDSSIIERLNGKSDNTLITNLGKNCKEIKLSKCPVNENMTGFVLNNGRYRGRTRSCIMSPSADTPLKRLNKKIMRHKSRDNKKWCSVKQQWERLRTSSPMMSLRCTGRRIGPISKSWSAGSREISKKARKWLYEIFRRMAFVFKSQRGTNKSSH